jgi:hypothetical protein
MTILLKVSHYAREFVGTAALFFAADHP